MSTPVLIVGYLASISVPLAFLPQTITTIIKKETKGISITSYTIYLLGCLAFLVFGIYYKDIPMIICEAIGITFGAIILFIALNNLLKEKQNKLVEKVEAQIIQTTKESKEGDQK